MQTTELGFSNVFRGKFPPEYFILPGNPPSLKNGKVLFLGKTKAGKTVPRMTSKESVKDWATRALPYIMAQAPRFKTVAEKFGKGPVVLIVQYFVARADRFDFSNKAETVADALSGSLYKKDKTAAKTANHKFWVKDDSYADLILIPHPVVFKSKDPFVIITPAYNYVSYITEECPSPIHTGSATGIHTGRKT